LDTQSATDETKKFQLEGSILHYPQFLAFKIEHMLLNIRPDLDSKTLKDCEQQLRITALQDLDEIKLDIAELDIKEVGSLAPGYHVVNHKTEQDKLVIKLDKKLPKNATIDLNIKYSAGYYHPDRNGDGNIDIRKPKSGFHFILADEISPAKQAWSQGEMVESKYWFPCLDDPQVKFTREIRVTVPDGYTVISNGKYKQLKNKENMTTWTWSEERPISTYLTSVVVGKFSHSDNGHSSNSNQHDDDVSLDYYWPNDIDSDYDAMLTFGDTPNIIKFYEEYFGKEYPFEKYSQVAVDEFEYGGMENASCTTLTRNILHDRRTSLDYTFDKFVVAHELAHQWFGDLVTCKEWSHTWLNEGFATFCEALYWEKHWESTDKLRRDNEYNYKILQTADRYFSEAKNRYKRSIVTNLYKSPEELFDDHSYRKGGCVLHMLRRYIGDDSFRRALKVYLKSFSYRAVDTDDLRKVLEEESGMSLQQFFNQWLYKAGHPELEIEYSLVEKERKGEENERANHSKQELKIKITQVQEDYKNAVFEFPLELRVVLSNDSKDKEPRTIQVSKKVTEYTYDDIPKDAQIKWISIDPEFKILNEIKSLKVTEEKKNFSLKLILTNQLKGGKTVFERIQAARILKDKQYLDDNVISILQEVLKDDDFYGVSVEAANTLGSYSDKSNYDKSDRAYQALKMCFDKHTLSELAPQVRRAIVANIGGFEKQELLDKLIELLHDESYFVEYEAANAIGKCSRNISVAENAKKMEIVRKLMNLVDNTKTFQNILAQGAINGLKEFSKDENMNINDVDKIANFLIEKTSDENEYYVRSAAASALGKFLATENKETNRRAFGCLKQLLKDKRQRVKINACTALADSDAKVSEPDVRIIDTINELAWVAGHDLDGFVRRPAEDSLNIIREWIKEWAQKPPRIDTKMREEKEEKREYQAMAIKEKHDHEKRLEVIRRSILEY
jgi:aminopeptidase N